MIIDRVFHQLPAPTVFLPKKDATFAAQVKDAKFEEWSTAVETLEYSSETPMGEVTVTYLSRRAEKRLGKSRENVAMFLPGWCFGTWNFMTFHILGIFIPTDFHIFQRGRYTTNQLPSGSIQTCPKSSNLWMMFMGFSH